MIQTARTWGFLSLNAAILALVLPRTLTAQIDLSEMIATSERSVVRIEVHGARGESQGSGFIVESTGLLVTNFHVMAGAERAIAHFPSGTKYPITGIKLLDADRDIAIATIDATNLPVLKPASSLPRKGEIVVGLGSPLGLSFTATNGIVSAIRTADEMQKELGDSSRKGTWIQVDAALSPGNSGGPLVNAKGEFVAMSTLASSGIAQNINFGISVEDIREAIAKASTRPSESLATTTAKATMKDRDAPIRGDAIGMRPVPTLAIAAYIQETRDAQKPLTKALAAEKKRQADQLKEMKAGQDFIPGNVPQDVQIVREQFKKNFRWYFRSANVKQQAIQKAESRTKELSTAYDAVNKGTPSQAMLALATKFGPLLNPQREGSLGFMTGATVLHVFTKNDLIVEYNDAPYLMYMDSTAGLFAGQEINPTVVFVAGTATAPVRGTTISITILQAVSDDVIQRQLGTAAATDLARQWKSKDGKFAVEATLVHSTDSEVILKRIDNGKEIKVPLSKLSDEDLQFIDR